MDNPFVMGWLNGFGCGCFFFFFFGLPRWKSYYREEWDKEAKSLREGA